LIDHYKDTEHVALFQDFVAMTKQHIGNNLIKTTAIKILNDVELLIPNAPNHIVFMLTLYEDMFIKILEQCEVYTTDEALCTDEGSGAPIEHAMPTTYFHSGMIPNHVNKLMQCSFWTDSGKQEPIVHLLSKSTPQRCQIRSLSHIVYNYARLHTDVYDFLIKCLKCSLFGTYSGVQRPSFTERQRLHKRFQSDKHNMLGWMKDGHQQLLFFTIKEYLIFAVKCLPALRSELIHRYNWIHFETTVTNAMDNVRQVPDNMDSASIESMLLAVNKSQTNLYRPVKHPFVHFLLQEFERQDDANNVTVNTVNYKHVELLYNMMIRVHSNNTIPYDWLKYFGAPKETYTRIIQIQYQMEQDGIKLPLRKHIASMSVDARRALRCIAIAYDRHINIRLFTLPVHITVEQIRALRQLYNVKNGEEAPEMGNALICLQCKKFKGFVAHMKGKNVTNLFAYGHSKVLIDFKTGSMCCGRRCDNTEKKRETSTHEFENESVVQFRTKKRNAKELRKKIKNQMCASSPLVEVPLLGNVLQYYGNLYTVCPQCGSFMKYDPTKLHNGMFCGCCIKDGIRIGEIQCARCGDQHHLVDPIVVEGGEIVHLCKQHYKPWIREATCLLTKEIILRGLEEKWKRLQSI
jgi:hypothetical protein